MTFELLPRVQSNQTDAEYIQQLEKDRATLEQALIQAKVRVAALEQGFQRWEAQALEAIDLKAGAELDKGAIEELKAEVERLNAVLGQQVGQWSHREVRTPGLGPVDGFACAADAQSSPETPKDSLEWAFGRGDL